MHYYKDYIQRIHQANATLGPNWSGYSPIANAIEKTQLQLTKIEQGHHIEFPVIGIAGLKNAGKTTLLSWLLQDANISAQLKKGVAHNQGTQHITWIGKKRPSGLDSEDSFISTEADGLFEMGTPYCLLDIPGSNEQHQTLSKRAIKGLNNSLVVALAVTETQLEDEQALQQYLKHSHNSIIIPIINMVSPKEFTSYSDQSPTLPEHAIFHAKLCKKLPNTRILKPIAIPDFDHISIEDPQEFMETTKQFFRNTLKSRLKPYLGSNELNTLRQKQMQNVFESFQKLIQHYTSLNLEKFNQINTELQRIEDELPKMALSSLLEPETILTNALKQGVNGVLLQRSPSWGFPWRPILGLMALLRGALDKAPLLLTGSITAVVQSSLAVSQNIKSGKQLKTMVDDRLKTQLNQRIHKNAEPWLLQSQAALEHDLNRNVNIDQLELKVHGLESLQLEFGKLLEQSIEQYAIKPFAAMVLSLVGLTFFWGLFIWPLIDIYSQFFLGIEQTLQENTILPGTKEALSSSAFTNLVNASGTFFNGFILSILPVIVLASSIITFNCRERKIKKMQKKIIQQQHIMVRRQQDKGLLNIQVDLPEINACRLLLQEVKKPNEQV